MVKSSQEWVSAAVDGEVDDQTLAQLASDVDSHQEWQRYHMIGDTMRGELPAAIDLDITASIAAAIALEPTIMAPKAKMSEQDDAVITASQPSNVVSLFKQFGQYAIAASVALVAIVGVQSYDQDPDSPLPVFNTRPLVGTMSPVSLQTGPVVNKLGYTNEQVLEQRRRVNAYIQDHMLQQRLNPSVEAQKANTADVNQ
ncbi:sigma-E factor negative regulatory protein [Shewanella sp. HL-SH5]|uniref:sigma-E factor negative regulatory protein n=1 Tax=Shewanella sp. HL-SH5 TaxID=3436241 RepID=UPI003EBC8780